MIGHWQTSLALGADGRAGHGHVPLQIVRIVVIDVSESPATGPEPYQLLQVVAEGTQLVCCGAENEVFLRT